MRRQTFDVSPRRVVGFSAAVIALALSVSTGRADRLPASYPEGPVVIDDSAYVAEMTTDRVLRLASGAAPESRLRAEVAFERSGCGPTALAPLARDRIVVLCHLEGALAVLDAKWRLMRLITVSDDDVALDSPNDISADGAGGAYFSNAGRFAPAAPPVGRVMRITPDLSVQTVAAGLKYANGVAVDRGRRRVLVSEHLARRVLSFPLRPDGALGPAEVFLSARDIDALAPFSGPLMGPDGIEIGAAGQVYVAIYGGGAFLKRSADGALSAHPVATRYLCNLTLWNGSLVLAGAYNNSRWPYPGEIAIVPAP